MKLLKESVYKVTVMNNILRTNDTSLLEEVEFSKSNVTNVIAALELIESHGFDFDFDIDDVLSNKVKNIVQTSGDKFLWVREVTRFSFTKTKKWTVRSTGQTVKPSQVSTWESINASLALAESDIDSITRSDMKLIAPQIMIGL